MCQSEANYEKFKVKDSRSQIQLTFWKWLRHFDTENSFLISLCNFMKENSPII